MPVTTRYSLYLSILKPLMDRLVAVIVLVVTSPILLMVILLIALANNGRVFFLQERPGRNLRIFKVIKFKTMNDQRNSEGVLLSDQDRLTAIGKFVRSTSIDELPQLINVVRGEMSLVGPRPLLVEYIPRYSTFQLRRHEVLPGITGWAQIHGRNELEWKRRFELDVWYVDHQSFFLDLKIILLTIGKVFKAEGISSTTSVTMEKFNGNS